MNEIYHSLLPINNHAFGLLAPLGSMACVALPKEAKATKGGNMGPDIANIFSNKFCQILLLVHTEVSSHLEA
jgi:hypothetical protein